MDIQSLINKYKLIEGDWWKCQKSFIVSHNAIEKIMAVENIIITGFEVLNSEKYFCRFLITAEKDNREVKTIGEAIFKDGSKLEKTYRSGDHALAGNCDIDYVGSMAEKRGIDRAVLKLINAYEYGIYSEVEADDFKRSNATKPEPVETIENLRKKATSMYRAIVEPTDPMKEWIAQLNDHPIQEIKGAIKKMHTVINKQKGNKK